MHPHSTNLPFNSRIISPARLVNRDPIEPTTATPFNRHGIQAPCHLTGLYIPWSIITWFKGPCFICTTKPPPCSNTGLYIVRLNGPFNRHATGLTSHWTNMALGPTTGMAFNHHAIGPTYRAIDSPVKWHIQHGIWTDNRLTIQPPWLLAA